MTYTLIEHLIEISKSPSVYTPAAMTMELSFLCSLLEDSCKKCSWSILSTKYNYVMSTAVHKLFTPGIALILGWPKGSFRCFCNMVWRNPDKPFGQPNTSGSIEGINEILCVVYPSIFTILENKTMKLSRYLTLIIPLYAAIKNTYFMQDCIFPKKHCEKSGTILHFGTHLVHSGTHVWLIRRQLRFSLLHSNCADNPWHTWCMENSTMLS